MIIDTLLQDRRWVIHSNFTSAPRLGLTIAWGEHGIIVATPDGRPLRYLTDPTPVPWTNIISLHKTEYDAQRHLERTNDA